MTRNGITNYKIKDLREDVNGLKNDMRLVLENHLPHLHEEIQSLKVRVNVATAINVGAIIVGVLIAKYL